MKQGVQLGHEADVRKYRLFADGFSMRIWGVYLCGGSNYIWAWETTRIMRELVQDAGGLVVRERYLGVGETDTEAVIAEIQATAPDFIFSTLIGESTTHTKTAL